MGELHGWRLCPRCGGELTGSETALGCAVCGSRYYANSAVSASGLVESTDGARVLLGRRAVEPARGRWDTVGGFLDEGEDPIDGLRRELREEAGIEVSVGPFVGGWSDRYGTEPSAVHTLNLAWVVTIIAGEPRAADDVSELRWFSPDELPGEDGFAFPWVRRALSAWMELRRGPGSGSGTGPRSDSG